MAISQITSNSIAAGAVSASDLADASITPAKLSTGAPYWDSSGNLLVGTTTHYNYSGSTTEVVIGTPNTGPNAGGAVTFGSGSGFIGYLGAQESQTSLGTVTATPLTFATTNTERMRIDSSGRVTMPYQPYVQARFASGDVGAYNNMISGADSKPTTVSGNLTSMYNSSNGRFTAPVAGLYEFSFSTNMYCTNSPSWISVKTLKNGAVLNEHYSNIFTTAWQLFSFSDKVPMNAGDYLNLYFATPGPTTGSDTGTYSPITFRLIG